MTEQATFPKTLPRWVYGGAFGCAVILAWLAWHKYRPASAEEVRTFSERAGGMSAVDCIQNAERVYATRVAPKRGLEDSSELPDYEAIAEPFEVPEPIRDELKMILSSPRSYDFGGLPECAPTFGIRLRFVKGNDATETWLCLRCAIAAFRFNDQGKPGGAPFRHARSRVRQLAIELFPDDPAIANAEH